jgi:hypothetical protein
MKIGITILAIACATGCVASRRPGFTLQPKSQEYFADLPDVSVPPSPYSDPERTYWFSVGYREGYNAGQLPGVSTFPRYPQHPQCLTNTLFWSAQTNGFEKGEDAGFAASQKLIDDAFDEIKRKLNANKTNGE